MENGFLTKMNEEFHGKRIVFSTTSARIIEQPYAKIKIKTKYFDPYYLTIYKINLKWIIHLNVKTKMIIILAVNMGENLCDLVLSKDILDTLTKA